MAYCEDYPCCGHTPEDPCDRQWYDEPGAFDVSVNPHAFCEHEYGICEADEWGDEWGCEDEADPDTCEHGDWSCHIEWRGEELWLVNRECDLCHTDLPETQETDPELMELHRYN